MYKLKLPSNALEHSTILNTNKVPIVVLKNFHVQCIHLVDYSRVHVNNALFVSMVEIRYRNYQNSFWAMVS